MNHRQEKRHYVGDGITVTAIVSAGVLVCLIATAVAFTKENSWLLSAFAGIGFTALFGTVVVVVVRAGLLWWAAPVRRSASAARREQILREREERS